MTFCVRGRALAVVLAAALGACDGSTDPQPGAPAALEVVDGNGQVDTVGQPLPQPVRVRVVDDRGRRVPAQAVNFVVTQGNGSVPVAFVASDAKGIATIQWTLGTQAGTPQTLEARVAGPAGQGIVSDPITATARVGAPARLVALDTLNMGGAAGGPARDSLVVRVLDQFGNQVAGADVQWAVTEGGGSVSPAHGTSDAQGIARAQWTLGPRTDVVQSATASVPGTTRAAFHGRAATEMNITRGNREAVETGSQLPVAVSLSSPSGPVRGVRVQWTVLSGGGSVTPASSLTGQILDGQASAVWTLGPSGGTQTLQATAGPLQQTFTATVIAQGTRTLVGQVPGWILDADRSRILWLDFGGGRALKLRTGGSDVTLTVAAGTGSLFPGGVLFSRPDGPAELPSRLLEYRNGAVQELGMVRDSAVVDGTWAAWMVSASGPVVRRDLAQGRTDTVAARHDQARHAPVDVGPDGDVAWNYHLGLSDAASLLYSYRDGATTLLLNTSNQGPLTVLTDGVNIIYRTISTGGVAWWRVRDGDDELLVQASNLSQLEAYTPVLNAGWLAWIERGPAAGTYTGRLRSPDGTEHVIAPGLQVLRLEALSPDGQVVFHRGGPNGGPLNWRSRALTTPDGPVYDLGYSGGNRVVWAGDRFLLLFAGDLYELRR